MGILFWFRQDLRLHDQPALIRAIELTQQVHGSWLMPVYIHDPAQRAMNRWGFVRCSEHRQGWLIATLMALKTKLEELGSDLLQCVGDPSEVLLDLIQHLGATAVVCEEIAAPEEQHTVEVLRKKGVAVHTVWQSSLFDPSDLPFSVTDMPDTFTPFRQILENKKVQPREPATAISCMPSLPPFSHYSQFTQRTKLLDAGSLPSDPRSSFPCHLTEFQPGEEGALLHLKRYCERMLPHTYKATRNQLIGADYSSKWSPWLATGALSARHAWATIQNFERAYGANEGTYWLWFELLWRDYFRFLHIKYGNKLYLGKGLSKLSIPKHDPDKFYDWSQGKTGNQWIDAGMRELLVTGYISNRMRQNVASYLIHDLNCDWRAGAAWFESNLIDYDVYNNQGNWLYLSGRGTDPRSNRRFNYVKQSNNYDSTGEYRMMWCKV